MLIDERMVRKMMYPPFKPHLVQEQILKKLKKINIIEAGRQGGKTASLTEKVRVVKGWKTVGDIQDGDIVMSGDGNWRKIVATESPYFAENLKKYTLRSGRTFVVTDEHKMLSEKGYIPMKELEIGDHIACLRDYNAGNEDIGDDVAKILGYLIGDGCTTKNVGFTQKQGKSADEFVDITYKLGMAITFRPPYHFNLRNPDSLRGRMDKNEPRKFVKKYGLFGKNAYTKTVPDVVWSAKRRQKQLFLSRLFACDSHCRLSNTGAPTFEYVSVSEELARGVQILLGEIGIASRLKLKKTTAQNGYKGTAWRLLVSGQENIELLLSTCAPYGKEDQNNELRETIGKKISLSRCDNIPKSFCQFDTEIAKKVLGENARQRPHYAMTRWKYREFVKAGYAEEWTLNYHWDPIVSIEDKPNMVRHIQVEEDETFLLGDAVSHNSILVGYICVRELLKPNTKTWVVAPYLKQTNIIWDYIYPTCSRHPDTFKIRVDQKRVECKQTGSILECHTAENPAGLLGATLTGLVLDEAAEMSEDIWRQRLQPTLTVKNGWCIMISTPITVENWFHQLYVKAENGELKDALAFHFTSYDNPYQSKEAIDEIKRQTPEFVFQQQYLAIPHSDSGLVFKDVRRAVVNAPPINSGRAGENRFILGWDPARARDYSVICVVDRTTGHLVFFDRSNNIEWDIQQERVLKIARRYGNAKIIMDATGIGDPLLNGLQTKAIKEKWQIFVEPYKISTNRAKVELIETLAVMIQEWEITYPPIPELLHELMSFRYFESDAGNIRYDHPKGEHDDAVSALALCAWEQRRFPFKKGKSTIVSPKKDYIKVY